MSSRTRHTNGKGRRSNHNGNQSENGAFNGRGKRTLPPHVFRPRSEKRSPKRIVLSLILSLVGLLVLLLVIALVTVTVAYTQIAGNLKPRLEDLKNHQSFQSSR